MAGVYKQKNKGKICRCSKPPSSPQTTFKMQLLWSLTIVAATLASVARGQNYIPPTQNTGPAGGRPIAIPASTTGPAGGPFNTGPTRPAVRPITGPAINQFPTGQNPSVNQQQSQGGRFVPNARPVLGDVETVTVTVHSTVTVPQVDTVTHQVQLTQTRDVRVSETLNTAQTFTQEVTQWRPQALSPRVSTAVVRAVVQSGCAHCPVSHSVCCFCNSYINQFCNYDPG
ncbi:unnamed protein product [Meganyctiphanes norvegica]|uniref:Uncharacterized protein n=1 Tax=Meganyctiphanes norvegica TaxID=48144 RepID=A0AAV2Q0B2_MEGNR